MHLVPISNRFESEEWWVGRNSTLRANANDIHRWGRAAVKVFRHGVSKLHRNRWGVTAERADERTGKMGRYMSPHGIMKLDDFYALVHEE